jgi:hypothetical protein
MTAKQVSALNLQPTERILTAYAQPAKGPGWNNRPLWVIIENRNGEIRQECLQQREFSDSIHVLYDIAAEVHARLMEALATELVCCECEAHVFDGESHGSECPYA